MINIERTLCSERMRPNIKKIKLSIGYDSDPPACKTCIHFSGKKLVMQNSVYVKKNHFCKKFYFITKLSAVCDKWKSAKGDVIADDQ